MEKLAVRADADVASLAAALMVQRPPARPREDACSKNGVVTKTGKTFSGLKNLAVLQGFGTKKKVV